MVSPNLFFNPKKCLTRYGGKKEVFMSTPTISKLSGTGYRNVNIPSKSPQQMDIFRQLMGGAQGGVQGSLGDLSSLAGGGDEESWQKLEAPALRQFGQLQGNISSRFSGMGSGARRSSGFQNTVGGAGTDLAERLQSNRMGLQQSAQQQLLSLYQNLLGEHLSDNAFLSKKKPFWQELVGGLAPGLGQAAGNFGSMVGLRKLGY